MASSLLIVALPFLSFLLIALVRPLRRRGRVAGWLGIVTMAAAFVLALATWFAGARGTVSVPWLPGDGGPMATVGLLLDGLSSPMLVLVTLISLLVQVYSLAYLHDEPAPSLGRYYAYHSLFAFSMLGLVLSPTYLQMFVFWELVGLCSYLLIGFWYARPAAARAAVKAFWTTKLGDLGFIAGVVMLWSATGTFEFETLFRMAKDQTLPVDGLATIMFLIYLGAMGKSAQFPLHVWLPDAMEGPTPVSALIHAATMVTAGVFLVARSEPLFVLVPGVLALIAQIGAFTALLAATMACVERDIKRVLAYSTVSQLGYMMAAAGAGASAAGFFHLLTHGVFKALLFLGAGAVIHAVGTNDIFRMGGLWRVMPQTGVVFIVGTLALAGVWPLAGFFSKEAVLEGVWADGRPIIFLTLALTALLTAFYMFRVVFITFFGRAYAHGDAHPHDPPWLMRGPLWLLAALTVGIGLRFALPGGSEHQPAVWLTTLSLALAFAGIFLAWAMYGDGVALVGWGLSGGWLPVDMVRRPFAAVEFLARRRYFLDAIYGMLYRGFLLGFSRLVGWIDRYLVDGCLNVASAWTLRAGDALRRIQSGQAQDYVYGVTFGVLLLLVWAQWWRSP